MTILIALVPLLPLLGFIILGLGFRSIPKRAAKIIGPGTILVSFILSLIVLINSRYFAISPFRYLFTGSISAAISSPSTSLSILFDSDDADRHRCGVHHSCVFIGYMSQDKGFNRFFAYMNLFIFFMLVLVMGANYVVMFIGWEGVGLCSYLLIGFWFKNRQFNNAAKKAFIMNRIGDLGFLLGMFLIFATFRNFNYHGF